MEEKRKSYFQEYDLLCKKSVEEVVRFLRGEHWRLKVQRHLIAIKQIPDIMKFELRLAALWKRWKRRKINLLIFSWTHVSHSFKFAWWRYEHIPRNYLDWEPGSRLRRMTGRSRNLYLKRSPGRFTRWRVYGNNWRKYKPRRFIFTSILKRCFSADKSCPIFIPVISLWWTTSCAISQYESEQSALRHKVVKLENLKEREAGLMKHLNAIESKFLRLKVERTSINWGLRELDAKVAQLGDDFENILEVVFSSLLIESRKWRRA